jgi:NTP pyrophosphatase (non-canonical NTP hydrolase)
MDDITRAIDGAADRIIAYRFVRLIETGGILMPLELKGLKSNMRKLQSTVEELNSIAIAANEKGSILKSHLGDIREQIGDHVDDIEFTANMLGNSSGESEKLAVDKLVEKPEPAKQVTTPPANDLSAAPQIPAAPAPVEASPAVGEQPVVTFPCQ